MTRYAVIDFETNGLMPEQGGRALEIGVVLVEGNEIVDRWQSLMNPGGRVPPFITGLTGITTEMVRAAPPPDRVMAQAKAFVGDATLVAHNASFDRRFWCEELGRIGVRAGQQFLCTVLIARRLYPWAPNHKLATLVELHRIVAQGRHHRALADADMTAQLWLRMQRDLAELYAPQVMDEAFLRGYQKTSKSLVRATAPYRFC